jgi:hypothetical protein
MLLISCNWNSARTTTGPFPGGGTNKASGEASHGGAVAETSSHAEKMALQARREMDGKNVMGFSNGAAVS